MHRPVIFLLGTTSQSVCVDRLSTDDCGVTTPCDVDALAPPPPWLVPLELLCRSMTSSSVTGGSRETISSNGKRTWMPPSELITS